jgi:hypothetical protein
MVAVPVPLGPAAGHGGEARGPSPAGRGPGPAARRGDEADRRGDVVSRPGDPLDRLRDARREPRLDIERVVTTVQRSLAQHEAIERERRGMPR